MTRVLVVDIETTGLSGFPADLVVDIGISSLELDSGIVEPVYSSVVGHDVSSWGFARRNAWIFENSDLTIEEVGNAKPFCEVLREVRSIVNGHLVTSFNTSFDFDRFLLRSPWNLKPVLCPDIMAAASRPVSGSDRWPRLDAAYRTLCPDDPAAIRGAQRHRALEDSLQAAHVLWWLYLHGYWTLPGPDEVGGAEPCSRQPSPVGEGVGLEGA